MWTPSQVTTDLSTLDVHGFSRDEMLDVLSNQRRRFTIHYLKQHDGESVTVSDLAEQVASWENETTVGQLTHQERKRVVNALRQFHLPKMDDHGFVQYDVRRGTVELTAAADDANFYVDSLSGGRVSWGVYYLCFALVSSACLVGLWIDVALFSFISPLVYGIFFVTTLLVSSAAHFYDNYYRMRLRSRDVPPEVDAQ